MTYSILRATSMCLRRTRRVWRWIRPSRILPNYFYYWIVIILLYYFSYKNKICVVVKRIKETNAHDGGSFACWSETVRVITWRKSVHLLSCHAFVVRTVHISSWLDASVCVRACESVCVYVCMCQAVTPRWWVQARIPGQTPAPDPRHTDRQTAVDLGCRQSTIASNRHQSSKYLNENIRFDNIDIVQQKLCSVCIKTCQEKLKSSRKMCTKWAIRLWRGALGKL